MNQEYFKTEEELLIDQQARYDAILDEQRKHEEAILNESNR